MNQEKLNKTLENHKLWLETYGKEGTRANLQRANLRGADLRSANLRRANLEGANLRFADLEGAYLRGANLRGADLQGANLRNADLRNANLQYADLGNADLRNANLQGANLQNTRLPSPTMVLMANWGELSDELTAALMRLDASGHPTGEAAFDKWAKGGSCPYQNCQVQRVANFHERKECWGLKVPKMGLYEIMDRVLREKCEM